MAESSPTNGTPDGLMEPRRDNTSINPVVDLTTIVLGGTAVVAVVAVAGAAAVTGAAAAAFFRGTAFRPRIHSLAAAAVEHNQSLGSASSSPSSRFMRDNTSINPVVALTTIVLGGTAVGAVAGAAAAAFRPRIHSLAAAAVEHNQSLGVPMGVKFTPFSVQILVSEEYVRTRGNNVFPDRKTLSGKGDSCCRIK